MEKYHLRSRKAEGMGRGKEGGQDKWLDDERRQWKKWEERDEYELRRTDKKAERFRKKYDLRKKAKENKNSEDPRNKDSIYCVLQNGIFRLSFCYPQTGFNSQNLEDW